MRLIPGDHIAEFGEDVLQPLLDGHTLPRCDDAKLSATRFSALNRNDAPPGYPRSRVDTEDDLRHIGVHPGQLASAANTASLNSALK